MPDAPMLVFSEKTQPCSCFLPIVFGATRPSLCSRKPLNASGRGGTTTTSLLPLSDVSSLLCGVLLAPIQQAHSALCPCLAVARHPARRIPHIPSRASLPRGPKPKPFADAWHADASSPHKVQRLPSYAPKLLHRPRTRPTELVSENEQEPTPATERLCHLPPTVHVVFNHGGRQRRSTSIYTAATPWSASFQSRGTLCARGS